jgi:UDP-glucose:(heptosyl)LPS alpha-1,3-glucosyltransferase
MSDVQPAAGLPVKRLRIAILNRLFKPTGGGAERYSIALVEQLAARHEMHVFAQQIEHDLPGVQYHRVPAPFTRPRWINQLWFALATRWMTRKGFDVVHSHENTWHGQVQTVHVLPIQYNLFKGRTGLTWLLRCLKVLTSPRLLVYIGLERLRYRLTPGKCIVVTAPGLRATMAQTFPATQAALAIVTPGVSDVPGACTAQEKGAARHSLGLPQTGHCILFVGNDYRKKGLPALLQALTQLPIDSFLAVVGNAVQIAEFRPQAQALGLRDRVFFLGALSDINTAYRAADCLAHPTLEDTFGMVVLEAMAHGLPVVVSGAEFCGIADFLSHGDNAYVLKDPRDVAQLLQGLQAVLPASPSAPMLALSAQAFARDHLWAAQGHLQETIYQRVATQSAPAKGR